MRDDGLRGGAYAFLEQLSPGGLGWEFLRRRDDYRADFAAHCASASGDDGLCLSGPDPARWGLSFFADPELTATEQPVFWRPDLDEQAVVLAPAADLSTAAALRFLPETWPGELYSRRGVDGLHLLLRHGGDEHRLWAPHQLCIGGAFSILLPSDRTAALRADAALRFLRCVSAAPVPRPAEPSEARLERTRMSLRALDARLAGASYRVIAEALFGRERIDPATWKTSSLRDATIRLVRSGTALMRGEYRKLVGRRTAA